MGEDTPMRHWLAAVVFCCVLIFFVGAGAAVEPWEEYQTQWEKNRAQQTPKPNVYEQFGDKPSNLPNRFSIYSASVGSGSLNMQTMILLDHQTGRSWMLKGFTWTPIPYVGGAPR